MKRGVKEHLRGGGSWEEYYRDYQLRLAQRYLVPLLESWGVELEGKRMLEVGSGNGGCGEAFRRAGCEVTALEIDRRLVGVARELNEKAGVEITVHEGDVTDPGNEAFRHGPFDIVLMRDVVEHLELPERALANVKDGLADGGIFFVVFPPYYSPFGAHQQILPTKRFFFVPYNKLPYVQLLPRGVLARLARGEDAPSREVRRLQRIRLTLRRFERLVSQGGFRVVKRKFYLSRPTYALRYNLPVVGAGFLGKIPLLRELVVTGAYYLLARDE